MAKQILSEEFRKMQKLAGIKLNENSSNSMINEEDDYTFLDFKSSPDKYPYNDVLNMIKSLNDLLVSFGSFGLPQSVILAINKDNVSRAKLYKSGIVYSTVIFIIGGLFLIGLNYFKNIDLYTYLLLGVGAACLVLSYILRGILLTIDDGFVFNLITITPSVLLSIIVGFCYSTAINIELINIAWSFALTGALTLAISIGILYVRNISSYGGLDPNYSKLLINGMDVFTQSVTMMLQIYLFLVYIGKYHGDAEVGYFGFSLVLFQACLMPLQMLSPMFINYLSKKNESGSLVFAKNTENKFLLFRKSF
jgi:hypothetical protein